MIPSWNVLPVDVDIPYDPAINESPEYGFPIIPGEMLGCVVLVKSGDVPPGLASQFMSLSLTACQYEGSVLDPFITPSTSTF